MENNDNPVYHPKEDELHYFTPDMYRNVGKNCMVSILDLFDKNPYSRIYNSSYKCMENLRREIGWETARTERFRREPGSHARARKFSEFMNEYSFYSVFIL